MLGFRQNENGLLKVYLYKLKKGKLVTLIGPNGSGKSTTAKIALGIYKNIEGVLKNILIKLDMFLKKFQ